ncbi:DUF1559 domain-containing protein [Pirellulales bacterium]|nr:DUF1559 domain-containing protein [Pirellulales bacterium]
MYEFAAGASPAAKEDLLQEMAGEVVPLFVCPSRRPAQAYPTDEWSYAYKPRNATDPIESGGKTDYAANTGDTYDVQLDRGPFRVDQGTDPGYWAKRSVPEYTGVVFLRSEISMKNITDGASNTILIGEKYVNPDNYATGKDHGDNWHLFAGFDGDAQRAGFPDSVPLRDTPGYAAPLAQWGSAHPATCSFAYCDGSVRSLSFEMDKGLMSLFCNRQDGTPLHSD